MMWTYLNCCVGVWEATLLINSQGWLALMYVVSLPYSENLCWGWGSFRWKPFLSLWTLTCKVGKIWHYEVLARLDSGSLGRMFVVEVPGIPRCYVRAEDACLGVGSGQVCFMNTTGLCPHLTASAVVVELISNTAKVTWRKLPEVLRIHRLQSSQVGL